MIKALCILIMLPLGTYSQEQNVVLNHGVSYRETVHGMAVDPVDIYANGHDNPTFYPPKLHLPNESLSEKTGVKKFRFQAGISLGLGATESGIFRNAGLELKTIFFPWQKSFSGFSVKTGYEAISAYLPTVVIPFEMGFQTALFRRKQGQFHVHANMGWGFAGVHKEQVTWENTSAKGGFRNHFGITWFPGFFKDASFYTGVNVLFQNLRYKIESDWQQTHTEQRLQRLNLIFGVFL